jgi:hypothetical protein
MVSAAASAKAQQDLIDKTEIGELQNRYMFALDWWDADVYAGVFTEDGVLSWPEGHAEGREAIRAVCVGLGEMYRRQGAASAPTKMAHKRHFVSNRVIKVDGDQASARCYWFDFNNDNQPRWPYVQAYGYYEDELVRTSEGWLFTSRRIYNEMTEETPLENPGW